MDCATVISAVTHWALNQFMFYLFAVHFAAKRAFSVAKAHSGLLKYIDTSNQDMCSLCFQCVKLNARRCCIRLSWLVLAVPLTYPRRYCLHRLCPRSHPRHWSSSYMSFVKIWTHIFASLIPAVLLVTNFSGSYLLRHCAADSKLWGCSCQKTRKHDCR